MELLHLHEGCRYERRTTTLAETTVRRESAAQTHLCRFVFRQENAHRRSFKNEVDTVSVLRRLSSAIQRDASSAK
jgi:hypothetical protein